MYVISFDTYVSVVAIIVSWVIIVLVAIAIVCCIYRNRVRRQQRQRSVVLYNSTQIPQVNVQHHYSPGTNIIIPLQLTN